MEFSESGISSGREGNVRGYAENRFRKRRPRGPTVRWNEGGGRNGLDCRSGKCNRIGGRNENKPVRCNLSQLQRATQLLHAAKTLCRLVRWRLAHSHLSQSRSPSLGRPPEGPLRE